MNTRSRRLVGRGKNEFAKIFSRRTLIASHAARDARKIGMMSSVFTQRASKIP